MDRVQRDSCTHQNQNIKESSLYFKCLLTLLITELKVSQTVWPIRDSNASVVILNIQKNRIVIIQWIIYLVLHKLSYTLFYYVPISEQQWTSWSHVGHQDSVCFHWWCNYQSHWQPTDPSVTYTPEKSGERPNRGTALLVPTPQTSSQYWIQKPLILSFWGTMVEKERYRFNFLNTNWVLTEEDFYLKDQRLYIFWILKHDLHLHTEMWVMKC